MRTATMIDRKRLWLASALTWVAAFVAPRPMGPICRAYGKMLQAFPVQLKQGRTFGVITIPWALGSNDRGKAMTMQERAIEAATRAREGIETISRD